ncbi:hypothetical protein SDC9_68154 [bioreactor metagenome]|uniref:Uncharacterized protein n=1 Tax=bioreactor metagenome TaxID=1076179 RepID=A0A644Y031_9ZZZZ
MSTVKEISVRCAVCGVESKQAVLTSYSLFGEPDLDFRPAPMLRGAMKYWLIECPNCGYVAKTLRRWPCASKKTLRQIYSGLDTSLPLLAHAFHKRALYCEHVRDVTGALRAYLYAAWACDDAQDDIHAMAMRLKCLELAQKKLHCCRRSKWRKYMQLIADLLRRTQNIATLRNMDTNDRRLDYMTRELLIYQKALAEKHDFSAHNRAEIDLEPFDDFYEKKSSNGLDPSYELEADLAQALSMHPEDRTEALERLDCLRPHELNLPYHSYDAVLRQHQGLPVSTDNPYAVDDLAKVVTGEFLDMMETFTVPHSMVHERVTLQSKTCMAILYQLYTSPYLEQNWKNYANAQERLYLMRIDDLFSDDSYLVGLIEPRTLDKPK